MKKKSFLSLLLVGILFLSSGIFFSSCEEVTDEDVTNFLGWLFSDEDPSSIPDDINLSTAYGESPLPSSVDLSMYFPPIGDQGQYGTCVTWACGYNLRTYMYARQMGYSVNDLHDKSRVFSAKDLFWAIPNSKKGANCNGSTFQAALDVMISRGVATESVVPYTNLGNCSSSPQSSWTTDANNYKILNYRQVDQTVENLKRYLAQGKAVVFGAKLGDEFMSAKGDMVLTNQTYGYTGQHAYHAMILCGYDDNKGPGGAFRLVNSWGADWGLNGYIWVDYNYFIQTNKFAFASFIATNIEEEPNLDDPTSGYDLQAWALTDTKADDENPRMRLATYNVFNTGENTLYASDNWNILYLYYNAYDANDYGIILYDMYTNQYGTYGFFDRPNPIPDVPAQDHWATYINIPGQTGVANQVSSELFGGTSELFYWTYEFPNITGYYYLTLIADGFDVFAEFNEDNNYYFYTHDNGDPIYFINGIMQNPPISKNYNKNGKVPSKGEASDFQSVKTSSHPNAYSTKEIGNMIKNHRKSGELQKRAMQWKNSDTKARKYVK